MFESKVLETIIGLAAVYLLFSLICSAVVEVCLGLLAEMRARFLVRGLRDLLVDDVLVTRLLRHPLLAALVQRPINHWLFSNWGSSHPAGADPEPREPEATGTSSTVAPPEGPFPTYIPSATFAAALINLLADRVRLAPAGKTWVPNIEALRAAVASMESAQTRPETDSAPATTLPASPKLARVLRSVIADAPDLPTAQSRLEAWFNDGMDRVGGAYKRLTQLALAVAALAFTATLNLDTCQLAQNLWQDDTRRGALSELAANAGQFKDLVAHSGGGAISTAVNPGSTNNNVAYSRLSWSSNAAQGIQLILETSRQDLPLTGWQPIPPTARAVGSKILGLLLTIAAIALGAPFWFDLLNKLVNLRAGRKPPAPPSAPAAKPATASS